MLRRRQAFTLVELLVVIAIISILAALLLPALEEAVDTARIAACASNQKQVHLATVTYADDSDDRLPTITGMRNNSMAYAVGLQRQCRSTINWATLYCDATIEDALAGSYVRFVRRGILRCPGSEMTKLPYFEAQYARIDYWPAFSPGTYYNYQGYTDMSQPESAKYQARLSKAAEPKDGFETAFLFDNLWKGPAFLGQYDPEKNCHKPYECLGQNVLTGSGAVKFERYTGTEQSKAFGHPSYRVPRNYWYAPAYKSIDLTWANWTEMMVCDPTLSTDYFSTVSSNNASLEPRLRKYMKIW